MAIEAPRRGSWAHFTPWLAEARATLALSWPLIATNVAQVALNVTAVVMMGRLGPDELAGGVLGAALFNAVSIFTVSLVSATAPLIAADIGRQSEDVSNEIRRTFCQGVWTALAISIPFVLILHYSESILILAGQEPKIIAYAADYLGTLKWCLPAMLVYTVIRSFLSALERPIVIFLVGSLAVAANILFSWALTFGKLGMPALGLVGTGLSITLTSIMMFVILTLAILLDRRYRAYHLFRHLLTPDWPRLAAIWRLGFPAALTLAFEVTVFSAAFAVMGLISANALAAHGIALQIVSVAYMIPLGISQAASIRVGRAWGGADGPGITRAGWSAFALAVIISALVASFVLLAPDYLVGLFVDVRAPENRGVVELAIQFLSIAALFQVLDAAQVVGIGMLRGMHDTRIPMLLAAAGYWLVGLPLGTALAFWAGMGGIGIWIGMASALGVLAMLSLGRWHLRERLGLVPATAVTNPAPSMPVLRDF
jgi:MATE family multidrug resistance protein